MDRTAGECVGIEGIKPGGAGGVDGYGNGF